MALFVHDCLACYDSWVTYWLAMSCEPNCQTIKLALNPNMYIKKGKNNAGNSIATCVN